MWARQIRIQAEISGQAPFFSCCHGAVQAEMGTFSYFSLVWAHKESHQWTALARLDSHSVGLLWSCSVAQSCLTLCDPMDCSTPGSPVLPSPSPGVCSNSCPLSLWCHPAILFSVIPFSSCCLQSFPASGSFLMSQLFDTGGQNIQRLSFQWIFRIDFL